MLRWTDLGRAANGEPGLFLNVSVSPSRILHHPDRLEDCHVVTLNHLFGGIAVLFANLSLTLVIVPPHCAPPTDLSLPLTPLRPPSDQ